MRKKKKSHDSIKTTLRPTFGLRSTSWETLSWIIGQCAVAWVRVSSSPRRRQGASPRLGSHHEASWQGSPTPGSFKAAAHDWYCEQSSVGLPLTFHGWGWCCDIINGNIKSARPPRWGVTMQRVDRSLVGSSPPRSCFDSEKENKPKRRQTSPAFCRCVSSFAAPSGTVEWSRNLLLCDVFPT